ncbi:MAG: copper resistance protein NlpE [Rikenellaceae bacterium]|nr:copper resistance protein NlpE [Rikenellaceae bacterium]
MKNIIILLAAGAVFASCGNSRNSARPAGTGYDAAPAPVESRGDRRDTDLAGTYRGSLPCADCGGIDVELRLDNEGRYRLRTRHISDKDGQKDIESEYEGTYSWSAGTRTVTLNGIANQPNRYLYTDGHLIQLDMGGKRIEGPLADKYVLRK